MEKKSKLFTKYNALENGLTKDNTYFLRDYTKTILYNTSGKNQFVHEHMIFVSNFFIRKLSNSKHWHIDGTFVYPEEFSQLIVILYKDDVLGKRFPELFCSNKQ